MARDRIGLVGPGRMGDAMVRHLVKHGYPVTVTDISCNAIKAAESCDAIKAAESCDAIKAAESLGTDLS